MADGGEIEATGERQCGFVVACGDAALMLEVPEHSLDAVTVSVSTEIAWNVLAPVGLGLDDRQDAARQRVRSNRVAVIALVRHRAFGLGSGNAISSSTVL